MSKVLQHIINKFIAEQILKPKKNNTKKPTDPICAMIKQTDSQNTIQVGKPGTNQPGGQMQAQSALSSEKAAAIKNGAVDAFIIVTCLKTGNNINALNMRSMITKLLSNPSNIPFMQQYTTTDHFGLVSSLYTTNTTDDSMIIPVWIFKGDINSYIKNNLMTIKDNIISQTQETPVDILNKVLKYINETPIQVGKIKNPTPNTNPPDPDYQEMIPLKLLFKDIDETLYTKYLNQILNNRNITFNANKTAVTQTTLTTKQIETLILKLIDNIYWDIKTLYHNPDFKKDHPGWDESAEGLAGIKNMFKLTIYPPYKPKPLANIGQINKLQFINVSDLLSRVKKAPVVDQLNKFFKFN